jgi:hypothetical protein
LGSSDSSSSASSHASSLFLQDSFLKNILLNQPQQSEEKSSSAAIFSLVDLALIPSEEEIRKQLLEQKKAKLRARLQQQQTSS